MGHDGGMPTWKPHAWPGHGRTSSTCAVGDKVTPRSTCPASPKAPGQGHPGQRLQLAALPRALRTAWRWPTWTSAHLTPTGKHGPPAGAKAEPARARSRRRLAGGDVELIDPAGEAVRRVGGARLLADAHRGAEALDRIDGAEDGSVHVGPDMRPRRRRRRCRSAGRRSRAGHRCPSGPWTRRRRRCGHRRACTPGGRCRCHCPGSRPSRSRRGWRPAPSARCCSRCPGRRRAACRRAVRRACRIRDRPRTPRSGAPARGGCPPRPPGCRSVRGLPTKLPAASTLLTQPGKSYVRCR